MEPGRWRSSRTRNRIEGEVISSPTTSGRPTATFSMTPSALSSRPSCASKSMLTAVWMTPLSNSIGASGGV